MDNYIVSARKYRPDSFDMVVGQDSITQTLRNSIKINQLAQAYLFCGPRGVGKTTCARIFAKTINCSNLNENYEACNECESCVAFNKLRSLNIHELDAASNNSVEDIRNLIDQVRIPPQLGSFSVYIIDEVHMLSSAAFNAFLKTLEEPPKHVIFILATTEKHKIIPTILSRCQIFDFNRISVEDIRSRLEYVASQEGINADQDALHIIAQKADGAMRDALSIFDQIVSFSGKNITYDNTIHNLNVLDYDTYFKITQAFISGDYKNALLIFDDVLKRGFEAGYFISGLASHFRDLLICKDPGTVNLLEVGQKIKMEYLENSKICSVSFLFKAIDIANKTDLNYKLSQNKRLLIEIALLNICDVENKTLSNLSNTIINNIKTEVPEKSENIKIQQDETKIPEETKLTNTTQEKLSESIKPEFNNPTEKLNSESKSFVKNISIKDLAKDTDVTTAGKSEEPKSDYNNLGLDDFDREKLSYVWTKYAETLRGNPRLYNFLTSHVPQEESKTKYSITVDSQAIKNKLDLFLTDTLKYMRQNLNNKEFELEYIVDENNEKKKFKTDEEKLQDMIQINPEIKKFKDQLNLDFE
ncbi:MAG TPA: DNA polymerase III subunit gamma/tau [Bacteroidales bacterium]|nr:DNA polymerase III subunit gamma/tau [Bacteroidales bacterium]